MNEETRDIFDNLSINIKIFGIVTDVVVEREREVRINYSLVQ